MKSRTVSCLQRFQLLSPLQGAPLVHLPPALHVLPLLVPEVLLDILLPQLTESKYVMLVYIRVSVVLTWQYSRKESQKLDISLDSNITVRVCVCSYKEI